MRFDKDDVVKMSGDLFSDKKPRFGIIKEVCVTGHIVISATNGKDYRLRDDNPNITKSKRRENSKRGVTI